LSDIFCDDCLEDHWPHPNGCECEFCDIPIYAGFLELHANRTINKIDLDSDADLGPGDELFWSVYNFIVENEATIFRDLTGEELHFLGRHGRHVCVDDILENRANYSNLRKLALESEKAVIKRVQEYDFSP
jgi:hypothetical protein